MKYLSLAVLLFIVFSSHAQTLSSSICKQYDTSTSIYAVAGYCNPVQRLADGSFLVVSLRGSISSDVSYYNPQIIKADTGFRPKNLVNQYAHMVAALTDGTIGSLSTINDDTAVSGLAFTKMDIDGNYINAKVIHSDWCRFYARSSSPLPAGIRFITDITHLPDSSGGSFAAPILVDVDNNGDVVSSDSIHINGFIPQNIAPCQVDADDAGNSIVYIYNTFGSPATSIVGKLAPDRTVVWTNELVGGHTMDPFAFVQLADSSVILGNSYFSHTDSAHSLLMKFSPSGSLLWQKESSIASGISSMKLLPNGNILLINGLNATTWGWWIPLGGQMMTEIDTAANVIWSVAFKTPVTGTRYTALSAPYIKSANEWTFAANTCFPNMISLFTTDSNGHSTCPQEPVAISFADTNVITVAPAHITLTHVNLYSVHSTNTAGTIPLSYDDGCIYDFVPPPLAATTATPATTIQLYPNPAFDNIHITLPTGEAINDISIYDALGRLCLHTQPPNNDPISISSLPQGYYTIKLTTTTNTLYYHKLSIIH